MNQLTLDNWFLDSISYFRGQGFFASQTGTDYETGEWIKAHWRGEWDEYLAGVSAYPGRDQLLLVADTRRVWWRDLEGVYPGSNYYVEAIAEWAAISRGQFVPGQVHEVWGSASGPATVTFEINGRLSTFVHRGGDYADHGILKLINRHLSEGAFQFEVATDFGDSNWVAVLTAAEKARLTTERGWHFLW